MSKCEIFIYRLILCYNVYEYTGSHKVHNMPKVVFIYEIFCFFICGNISHIKGKHGEYYYGLFGWQYLRTTERRL